MSKKGGVPGNLVNFKKGNDERRNVTGANAGAQSLKAILERLLSKEIEVNDIDGIEKLTRKEAIALKMVKAALQDGQDPNVMLKASKQIFENTDPITKDINLGGVIDVTGEKELSAKSTAALVKILKGG